MEKSKRKESMTLEEALQDPSLAHVHDVIRYLQKTPSKDIFPQKYESSMLGLARTKAVKIFKKNPNMPLKKVVSIVINYFDDDLTPDLILKITQATIEKWQTLSADLPVQQEAMAA